jgi:MFS family permease
MTLRPVFLQPNLLRFIAVRVLITTAVMVQAVALGWFVYAQTGSAFSLGLIGLAQFLPSIPLLAYAGYAADHFDRRKVVMVSQAVQALGAVGLAACVHFAPTAMLPIYTMVLVISGARSFSLPATASLLPNIVSRDDFPQAVAFSTSSMQFAAMVGPAFGGFVYAWLDRDIFMLLPLFPALAAVLIFTVQAPGARPHSDDGGSALQKALAGLVYVRTNRIIFGAMSLDLFAVLFGGVTALLPMFAQDILHVGPRELGLLRSGPTFGALLVGIVLTYLPVSRNAGATMLWSVVGFGLATIVFGLSTHFWLSFGCLVALGGFDMISMVIRQTLVQMAAPDEMRGRVSAVNSVFVGASNQLGSFESGMVASLIGAAPAAIVGGLCTLVVVGVASLYFPELRRADRIRGDAPDEGFEREEETASLTQDAVEIAVPPREAMRKL